MISVSGPGRFVETFERLTVGGATEILSIHVAGSLSAVVNSARLAVEEWGKLPVTVFDSGNLTLGTGLQVLAKARSAAEGQTIDEIMSLLEDLAVCTCCFVALDTVEFICCSGRLIRYQFSLACVLKMKHGEFDMERVCRQKR
jgi:DegV family protein with EDD domain